MIRLIPYAPEHMDLFEQLPEDIERYGLFTSETPNPQAEYGIAFTAFIDGRIVIVGGILQISQHTGKGWTMISKHALAYGSAVFYAVRQQLESMMKDMRLHRIETTNLKDATEHHRWCRLLGFKAEGEMPYYDDKKRTYIRLAKVMEVAHGN